MKQEVRVVSLGWCMARLDIRDNYPRFKLNIVSPADTHENSGYSPAESIVLVDEGVEQLRDFLVEATGENDITGSVALRRRVAALENQIQSIGFVIAETPSGPVIYNGRDPVTEQSHP